MPEVQTHPEKTTTPPAEPTRTRRWLPESRVLRWLLYIGVAIIAFNVTGFFVLLYFGTRPNLPYVDYFPEYRQLSIDAHARHGIAPPEPGQPDSWVILEGMRVRAEKIIESWKASEEDRRAAAEPPDFQSLDLYKMCHGLLRRPAPAGDHPDAPALRDLIDRLNDVGLWKLSRMIPKAAAAMPTREDLGVDAKSVERSGVVSVALLLCVRARLAAESGDSGAAITYLVEVDAIADRLASQPDMFTRLTSDWIRAGFDDAATSLASRRTLPLEALRRLADILGQHREVNFATALRGERIRGLHALQSVYYGQMVARPTITTSATATGADPGEKPSFVLGLVFRTFSSHRDNAEALTRCCDLMERADTLPFSEALKLDPRIRNIFDEIPDRLVMAKVALGSPPIAVLAPRASAWHAAASIAVAIERYRLDHDALPMSLDNLVPKYLAAAPNDPFAPDGRLRYRRDADPSSLPGYTLYSVGYDQTDDNGAPADEPFKAMYDAGPGTDYLFVSNSPTTLPPARRPNP